MFVPLEIQKVLNFEMLGTFKFYAKPIVSNLSIKEYASLVHPFSSFLWVCLNKKKKRTSLNTICSLLLFSVSCRKSLLHLIKLSLHEEGNEEQTMHQNLRQLRVEK